jgi:hypothetical protein
LIRGVAELVEVFHAVTTLVPEAFGLSVTNRTIATKADP